MRSRNRPTAMIISRNNSNSSDGGRRTCLPPARDTTRALRLLLPRYRGPALGAGPVLGLWAPALINRSLCSPILAPRPPLTAPRRRSSFLVRQMQSCLARRMQIGVTLAERGGPPPRCNHLLPRPLPAAGDRQPLQCQSRWPSCSHRLAPSPLAPAPPQLLLPPRRPPPRPLCWPGGGHLFLRLYRPTAVPQRMGLPLRRRGGSVRHSSPGRVPVPLAGVRPQHPAPTCAALAASAAVVTVAVLMA